VFKDEDIYRKQQKYLQTQKFLVYKNAEELTRILKKNFEQTCFESLDDYEGLEDEKIPKIPQQTLE